MNMRFRPSIVWHHKPSGKIYKVLAQCHIAGRNDPEGLLCVIEGKIPDYMAVPLSEFGKSFEPVDPSQGADYALTV